MTGDVAVVTADVSKADDVRRMINVAVDHYGRLDVAVANAGIIPLASVVEATADDWEEVMAIDGRGMFLTCKYAIQQMLINGGGSIICLSSISGVAGQARQSTYGPAKVCRLWTDQAPGGGMGRQGHSGQRCGARNHQH